MLKLSYLYVTLSENQLFLEKNFKAKAISDLKKETLSLPKLHTFKDVITATDFARKVCLNGNNETDDDGLKSIWKWRPKHLMVEGDLLALYLCIHILFHLHQKQK